MTGRTNYTAPTNGLAPEGPAQIAAAYAHFDALIGESVAAVANLPASGNWNGRTIYVEATDSVYVWRGAAWRWVAGVRPMARLTKSTAQSTSATPAALTAVAFNTESFDTHSLHDPVTNNTRITIPTGLDGYWKFAAHLEGASTTPTVTLGLAIAKNGTEVPGTRNHIAPTGSTFAYPVTSDALSAAAGDYLEVMCFSGAASAVMTPAGCVFSAEFLRAL
jgi:hypothetical protein